jgi:hypothetical protein
LTLNPSGQIAKSQDAKRQEDIQEVKAALDVYYQDHNCYPREDTIPFGREWRDGNTVYMKKVPQDPECKNGQGTCYKYRTDTTSSCPQWNVVFASLSQASSLANTCPLSTLSNCAPAGYTQGKWACTLSGAVNCSNLASAATIVGGIETVSPTMTPTPVPSATPTPTPSPTPTPTPPDGSVTYQIGSPRTANPYIYQAEVMPLYPSNSLPNKGIGSAQSIQVWMSDSVGSITSVKVVLISDTKSREFTLTRVSGTNTDGSWGGQSQPWQIDDTYNTQYAYKITATDDKGNSYSTTITVKN